jgi:uncharacterized protein YqjF (DUF2071 family)
MEKGGGALPDVILPERRSPWIMRQTWRNLLFAHWRMAPEAVRDRIPPQFELDTFKGFAWVGVIPFSMTDIAPRNLPEIPGLSATLEVNVRTYVRYGGRSAVYFFSLDAESLPLVLGARWFYHLPYYQAEMSMTASEGERIAYKSRRRSGGAALEIAYGPLTEPSYSQPGTVDHWLTERYRLCTVTPRGRVLVADIHHSPWPLQRAWADVAVNTMAAPAGIELPRETPLLRYARELQVKVWWPVKA